jgi:hypothetical protein
VLEQLAASAAIITTRNAFLPTAVFDSRNSRPCVV